MVEDYNLADLTTFMLSYHPQHIGTTVRGYYTLYPEKALELGIHMLSPNVYILFDTVIDVGSPLFFVESINDPDNFYKLLMEVSIKHPSVHGQI